MPLLADLHHGVPAAAFIEIEAVPFTRYGIAPEEGSEGSGGCDGSIGLNGVMRGLRYYNDYMRHARTPDPVIYLGPTRHRLH